MTCLDGLNDMQRKAVLHDQGPALIIAGPGSGKTRVITNRVAWLVRQGVNPERIMVVTFTRRAAAELRERVKTIIGDVAGAIRCGTFHSTCLALIRENDVTAKFSVIDDSGAIDILSDIAVKYGIKVPTKALLTDISFIKAWMMSPEETIGQSEDEFEEQLSRIYAEYENYLQRYSLVDFDNILWTFLQMTENAQFEAKIKKLFDYILVDEFQDTNKMQSAYLGSFLGEHQNLFVVGDYDQAIYSFRGTSLDEIKDFRNKFSGVKMIPLELNYRSTRVIVEASEKMITHNQGRIPKLIRPAKHKIGEPIEFLSCRDIDEEAGQIAKIVKNTDSGVTTAILVRTSWQAEKICEVLRQANINFDIVKDSCRNMEDEFLERAQIQIMTVHAAKGLEFDNVIVPGLVEGVFPHYLSVGTNAIAEERRLFYVALTRAKKKLYLLCYWANGKKVVKISRFVEEIPEKYFRE
jgi:DNA helicase-2/ATP-dependent DNA helicase PcrA